MSAAEADTSELQRERAALQGRVASLQVLVDALQERLRADAESSAEERSRHARELQQARATGVAGVTADHAKELDKMAAFYESKLSEAEAAHDHRTRLLTMHKDQVSKQLQLARRELVDMHSKLADAQRSLHDAQLAATQSAQARQAQSVLRKVAELEARYERRVAELEAVVQSAQEARASELLALKRGYDAQLEEREARIGALQRELSGIVQGLSLLSQQGVRVPIPAHE